MPLMLEHMIRTDFIKKISSLLSSYLKALLLALALVLSITLDAYATQLINARLWAEANNNTRLVVELSEPIADYNIFSLENPNRLVIDLKGTALVYNLKQLLFDGTPVSNIRWAPRNEFDLRIVLDLAHEMKANAFTLPAKKGIANRLVVDLKTTSDLGSNISVKNLRDVPSVTRSNADKKPVDNKQSQINSKKIIHDNSGQLEQTFKSLSYIKRSGRDIMITIDAGHGGKDPGAIGHNGAKEKNITLAIAREVASLFVQEKGFKAVLIRKADYYVPLRGRIKKAREYDTDLFVSIHADAFHRKSANGASIYTLSERGATSETARWLANRENNVDLIGGGDGISLSDKDNLLASVLLDLSMTDTQARSISASKKVLFEMSKVNNLHKKHVEKAAFVVLKSPDIPSMLVETGFISNPSEARKLSRTSHQKKVARAIYKGIKEFFVHQPPLGTWVALQREKRPEMHMVIAGETLSDIALRYNVSMGSLLAVNDLLSADYIWIGQNLMLP